MPMFVQTNVHVIDVEKINHIQTTPRGQVVINFHDGKKLTIDRVEAELLMDGMKKLADQKLISVCRPWNGGH